MGFQRGGGDLNFGKGHRTRTGDVAVPEENPVEFHEKEGGVPREGRLTHSRKEGREKGSRMLEDQA